jgi:two-component system OmpR family sensor kinase
MVMNATDSSLEVSVVDTGIGIAPEALAKIFDRFYRVDASRARAAGGSGLGLSIAQAICQMHNGALAVQSEPGKGSTFKVTLTR